MLDLSLYLVTDRDLSRGRATVDIVAAAVKGGATCVQLREKHCDTRDFVDEAQAVHQLLQQLNPTIPLIINDRVDVALAIGAEGVHLGQSDMRIQDARRLVGPKAIIGISAESVSDAITAEQEGADYLGISPVFSTPTKTDTAPPLGLQGIHDIRAAVRLPLVGIGGIHEDNVMDIIKAGADGAAVVSAIVSADSPLAAAQLLKQRIDSALKERTLGTH